MPKSGNKRPPLSAAQPTPKKRATLNDKLMVLDRYHDIGKNQSKTDEHFRQKGFPDMKQPLVSSWVAAEEKIRAAAAKQGADLSTKKLSTVSDPEFEDWMLAFVRNAEGHGLVLTGDLIVSYGVKLYDKLNRPDAERLKLSHGWLVKFFNLHSLRHFHFHGEANSANVAQVSQERLRVQELIKQYEKADVFNMDETALFYGLTPDRGIASDGRNGTKQSFLSFDNERQRLRAVASFNYRPRRMSLMLS